MTRSMTITELAAVQSDGLACISCGADYLIVTTPHAPVARLVTGPQVFACIRWRPDDMQRVAGGALR
jgi:hypothetical protein